MGFGEHRIASNSLAIGVNGIIEVAFVLQGNAEVIMGFGVVGP
jgi:hypothetical protein